MAFRKEKKATKKGQVSSKGEQTVPIEVEEIAKKSHDDILRILNRKMKDYKARVTRGEIPMPYEPIPFWTEVYCQNEQVRARIRDLLKKDNVLFYDGESSSPYMCKAVCYYNLKKKA